MDLGFTGKVALVTGAGSRVGIGREIALLLAREGCEAVVVSDIGKEDLDKTAAEIKQLNSKSSAFIADITDIDEVESVVGRTIDEFGRIDILCNVAGAILHKDFTPIDEQDSAVWEKQMKLNLFGTMYFCKFAVPRMRAQKGGAIVNIGSGSTHQYGMGVGTYAMSKYAMDLFTKQLATAEGRHNIRVNCVAPGPVRTNFGAVLREGAPKPTPEEEKQRREAMLAKFPLGRLGTPEDIANAAVLLASDITAYVTGQVLHVSGGNVM